MEILTITVEEGKIGYFRSGGLTVGMAAEACAAVERALREALIEEEVARRVAAAQELEAPVVDG